MSLWYKDHSTPSPRGVEPDPTITRTVVGDKFSSEGVEVVEEAGSHKKKLGSGGRESKED